MSFVIAYFLIVFFPLRPMTHRALTTPTDLKLRQITTNSSETPVSSAVISPDGKYLAYADSTGMRLQEIATGETHALPKPKTLSAEDAWFPSAWFPDGTRLVATAIKPTAQVHVISSVWSVPVLGNPILLRDNAFAPVVSPDGSMIAFTREPSGCNGPLRAFDIPWTREI
jgi:Tol biopolymer transport system component